MKDYKLILISFVLLVFMIGAVSASGINLSDNAVAASDEDVMGAQMLPITPIFPDDPFEDDPVDVEVDTKDIYVNDTGDDSNTGSKESPYATINRAISDVNASNDATIYISEGTFLLNGTVTHYVEDDEEWDEEINGFDIYLNHKTYGGNLKFIGAGADKTILDGQSLYYFASIGSTSNVTIKDITFVNCKNYNGGTIYCAGNLTIDNCVFKDSTSNQQGGAIKTEGSQTMVFNNGIFQFITVKSNVVIKNSQFISCSSQNGGAVYSTMSNLYLENSTFINTTLSTTGFGVAVYSGNSKTNLINNKFINLTGTNDASIYIQPSQEESVITGNQFINCSNPSETFSIVNLLYGSHTFENNTFINSSNSVGNIYCSGTLNNVYFKMDYAVINVSNAEVNKGFKINNFNITDDMGNIVQFNTITVNLNNEETSISRSLSVLNGVITFTFSSVPESGIYNLTLSSGESVSDVLAMVNISLSNEPVDLWVSSEGSDANNGSQESPFATIQHAIDTGFDKSFTVIIHLLKGTYTKDGNVELTIANKGNLQIIGEKYNETIIDGESTSWFLKVSTTNVNITNLSFINGKSTSNDLISGGNKLYLENCIVDNNIVSNSRSYYALNNVKFNKLTFTNNNGRIYVSNCNITDSYFANNYVSSTNGVLYVQGGEIKNTKFINNSANYASGGAISGYFTSINNYYADNHADQYGGAIYLSGDSTFVNDTFINNYASIRGGAFDISKYNFDPLSSPVLFSFENCKFINNSATKGGVSTLQIGRFNNCSFINNSADYGAVFYLVPYLKVTKTIDDILDDVIVIGEDVLGDMIPVIIIDPDDDGEDETPDITVLELNNCTFENNEANLNGNDIYLEMPANQWIRDDVELAYAINLTITFNNSNVTSLVDDLTATVYGPCGAVIGANYLTFVLNGTEIGAPEIVNSVATFNYAGFEEGNYSLNGTTQYPNSNYIINPGLISVKLENIVDHVDMWVAVNGSDENGNGSENNPFKSISKAMKEAVKNCRDITIYVGEGTYAGDLNTALTITSMNNITFVGAGIDKTIIDGENTTYFAKITVGNNKVVLSNLTIKNMLPENINDFMAGSKVINTLTNNLNGLTAPITVDENATLCLDNVEITSCRGGQAIIVNNGNILINNSIFDCNGLSSNGLIAGGNVNINNSIFTSNFAAYGLFYDVPTLVINNSVIKNNFNLEYFLLTGQINMFTGIMKWNTIIENTLIISDGDNSSLSLIGYNGTYALCPTFTLGGNLIANNISMVNNYESPLKEYTWAYFDGYKLVALGHLYGSAGKNVSVTNSSFINLDYIWSANTYGKIMISLDSCVFDNITMIAQSMTPGEGSQYNITNSVFVNCDPVIDRFNRGDRDDPNCTFENNYWGSNDKPVITYVNPGKSTSFEPTSWIVLYSEDEKTVIKNVTDGENSTNYTGNAPIRTDYADNKGMLDYAVVFGPVGYLFTTDDETNVIFDAADAIYPFVPVDPMDYRDNAVLNINKINGSGAVFCDICDVMGNPVVNATVVYTLNGVEANTTTDENGSFIAYGGNGDLNITFIGDDYYFPIEKIITLENIAPVKTETAIAAKVDGDLKISGVLADINGNPLANTLMYYNINGTQISIYTDDDGAFSIQGANNATVEITYEGDDTYLASTSYLSLEGIMPAKLASGFNVTSGYSITVYAIDYSAGERGAYFDVLLTDDDGNPLINQTVLFGINGWVHNKTTDENGVAHLQINLAAANKYTVAPCYLGDTTYNATFASAMINVVKKPITITASAKSYKASVKTKKYTATLKTIKGSSADGKTYLKSGKKVTLTVNGKTYSGKINAKGQVTFKITKLTKKGKYTAKIKFAGDSTYKASSKKVKITIK